MDKTDSKIRLFFELTYQKDVQITSYIPLKDYSIASWSPEKMYSHPHKQNYYVFINDPELIERIQEGEMEGQKYLFKLSDSLEKQNDLLIEFNANNIETDIKKPDEEQYIVFARISIDNFSFINDYGSVTKKQLMEKNRPLIYANQGRIKEYLLGEKIDNEKNDELNNTPNSSKNSIKEEDKKKDGDENDTENENKKKKEDLKKKADYIPGHWFLLNMNNLYFKKKNTYDKSKKNKIIKFLSVIKFKEITNEQDPQDPNNLQNNPLDPLNNINLTRSIVNQQQITQNKNNESNQIKIDVDMRFQQEREFCFRANENSKLITVYQPKSCKIHFKKNDFWCKDCNKFCCLECFVSENGKNTHKNHKIHLLDEVINKSDEDSNALEERIKNLIKIIDNEIQMKRNELQKLKNENKLKVEKIKKLYEEKNSYIKQEEIKRAKSLAALVNEILRIMNDYNRRINYLKLLFEKGSMNNYLTNYYIFKKVFETETKKNLMVLVRKVTDTYNYYMTKKANNI